MSTGAAARGRAALVSLGLVLAVLATYAEAGGFGFVRYDDPDYVLANPAVRGGLTWSGVRWALTAAHASNWHPLTWLAHMLDVECFGLVPAGHHWTSVGLHALGSVLCFLALRALSGRLGESALVAALFALHPLRVESVAWVSERKDVLSGCAFFALLLAYARYARAPGPARYLLVLLCFALGLAAKPMLVTAPFVLLLLDRWPLRRASAGAEDGVPPDARRSWPALWLEKVPLLVLAALACVVTVWSQRAGGALSSLELLPLPQRLANAPLAVARYLGHFVWPAELAYFYPHPFLLAPGGSLWSAGVLLALAGLVAASAAAFAVRRALPAVLLGWSWFLGMLVPVIGIVQVGEQALADRYSYLPLVGVQIALVFSFGEHIRERPRARLALVATALLALVACGLASRRQARAWKDSETLFAHALQVTKGNYHAHTGLANERAERRDLDGARRGYEAALAAHPRYAPALYGLGLLEQEHGDRARALALYREAAESLPGFAAAHLNLGSLLAEEGKDVEAAQAFERVLELDPAQPDAHFDLALLLLRNGRLEDARPHLESAVRARPEHAAAWEKLGELCEARGEHAAAIEACERALRDPARSDAARLLSWIRATAGEAELRDAPRALELARHAVLVTQRRDPRALEALAAAQARSGEFARATQIQDEALQLLPPGQQAEARARRALYARGEAYQHGH